MQILLWREVELGLASATFLKAFSLTYKTSGLPAARMAELSARTIGNSVIRHDFLQVRDELQSGIAFEDAFARPRMLKDVYKNQIATASISGRLDECLDRLARQAAEDVEVWLNRFNGVAHRVVAYSVAMSLGGLVYALAQVSVR
jgi:type II secretory pathway component PulF